MVGRDNNYLFAGPYLYYDWGFWFRIFSKRSIKS